MLAQGIICQNENVHSNHTRGECEKWFFFLNRKERPNPMENNVTNDKEKEKNFENWIK